ncbi:MAG: hypothetical protein GY841_14295 [FCB group bacterium]|nr:hypothetical protein [FCB group bacterium]
MGKLTSKILPIMLCFILIFPLSFCSKDKKPFGPTTPNEWSLVPAGFMLDEDSNRVNVATYAVPELVDIDDDNDLDLFIGEWYGEIWFYRNTGSARKPEWTFVTDNYFSIDVGRSAAPTFADIDNDGDYDLLIGKSFSVGHVGPVGNIVFYRNIGTADSANFILVTDSLLSYPNMGISKPEFVDIDGDNDLDLVAGYSETDLPEGHEGLLLFRNIGDRINPVFEFVTNEYLGMAGHNLSSIFADVDSDGDLDALHTGSSIVQICDQLGTEAEPDWSCADLQTTAHSSLISHMALDLADVNGDGILDLIWGNGTTGWPSELGGTVYLFYGSWDED